MRSVPGRSRRSAIFGSRTGKTGHMATGRWVRNRGRFVPISGGLGTNLGLCPMGSTPSKDGADAMPLSSHAGHGLVCTNQLLAAPSLTPLAPAGNADSRSSAASSRSSTLSTWLQKMSQAWSMFFCR